MIRLTKPWEKSTGPRTEAGKAKVSRNAYAGDWVHEMREQTDGVMAAALEIFGRKRWPKGLGNRR